MATTFPSSGHDSTFRVAVRTVSSNTSQQTLWQCFGTSFLLSLNVHSGHDGFRPLLTNEHVLSKACSCNGQLGVINREGNFFPVTKKNDDKELDLALLWVSKPYPAEQGIDLDQPADVVVGTQVHTWGFPSPYAGIKPLLTVGYVAGVQDSEIYVNMAINPGNSGGAILNGDGRLIAVVKSKYLSGYDDLEADLLRLKSVAGLVQMSVGAHSVDVGDIIHRAIQYTRDASQLVIGIGASASAVRTFLTSGSSNS